jgi:hypothetical protein
MGQRVEGEGKCLVALSVQASLEVAVDMCATSLLSRRVALLFLLLAGRAAFALGR